MKKFIIILLTVLSFMSCTLKSDIYLSANGDGTAEIDLNLNETFTTFVFDMQESMMENPPEERILFNEAQISEGLAKSESSKLLSFESEKPNELKIKLGFENINDVMNEASSGADKASKDAKEKMSKVISFEKIDENYKFKLYLDVNNFEEITTLIPEEAQTLVDLFGPDTSGSYTPQDYYDIIGELLSEYPEIGDVSKVIDNSKLELNVRTDNPIVSQKGGTISEDGKSVKFVIPFLDFIILDKPIELEVIFN